MMGVRCRGLKKGKFELEGDSGKGAGMSDLGVRVGSFGKGRDGNLLVHQIGFVLPSSPSF